MSFGLEEVYKDVMSEQKEELGGAVRLRQPERRQLTLRPECLEELVAEDHPVRMIWAVTGHLDLAEFYAPIRAREGSVGRDATDPRLLVALWLYAATEGIGSARELARLCLEQDGYRWLCGGVSLNHHTLSDFRVGHGKALDALLSQLLAALVEKKVVEVWRISQDGTRVRACAGASSFRRRERLEILLEQSKAHVEELKQQADEPGESSVSARVKAARQRAARERQERLEEALALLPELESRQQKLSSKIAAKDKAKKLRERRVSTTDSAARVMKMSDGGFRPALNVQLACDPTSRAIVGVEVSSEGVDTGLSEPLRDQVERRTGEKVKEHLLDGGYLDLQEIERATAAGVILYVPPKPPRNRSKRENGCQPRAEDSAAVSAWRQRMGSEEGQAIYRQRGSTIETVNADLKTYRGLGAFNVCGLAKARCVVLWSVLAYNLLHYGASLLT
jgi:transposase